MNEIQAKKNRQRNTDFLPSLRKIIADFEQGELVESVVIFVRMKNGDTQLCRSYSDFPEEDAAALMTMAMHRMGFDRTV